MRLAWATVIVVLSVGCGGTIGCWLPIAPPPPPNQHGFDVSRSAEAIATLTAVCDGCAWETAGREAVLVRVTLDDRYIQHLPLSRPGRASYRIFLGGVTPGSHIVRAELDRELTPPAFRDRGIVVESIAVEQIDDSRAEYRPLSLAPFVHARPDTVGTFNDVPLFMWYEVEPEAGATRYRFSVVFTNEDGGTPTDRLMATWGRTTDIEYLYSVAVDQNGAIVDQDMQGPDHETLKFQGQRDGQHPLLWVSTRNNMVLDRGDTQVRFGPAPVAFPLRDISREAVMDANPWLYDVMSRELAREGKIVADAPPGNDTIPDPRRFVYLEGCGEAGDRAIAFAIGTSAPGAPALTWHASDRGTTQYRIVRNGCFRAATPLPAGLALADVRAVRAQAYVREGRAGAAGARLTRINKLFMLDDTYLPGASVLTWQGAVALEPGAAPFEIPVK